MTEYTCELCSEPILGIAYKTVDGCYLCEECVGDVPVDELENPEEFATDEDYL